MPRPSRYSPAEKAAMLAAARHQLRQGISRKEIAETLGVKVTSLSIWLREQTLDMLYPRVPPTGLHNRAA